MTIKGKNVVAALLIAAVVILWQRDPLPLSGEMNFDMTHKIFMGALYGAAIGAAAALLTRGGKQPR
jgi:uncharacterized membrane protein